METAWSQRSPLHHPTFIRTPLPFSSPTSSSHSLPNSQTPKAAPNTHIGPSQAAELVLQVAGEVIGFLDGGTRPWVPCAIEGWHCREVPEHGAQAS